MIGRNLKTYTTKFLKFNQAPKKYFSSLFNSKDHEVNNSKNQANNWVTQKETDYKIQEKPTYLQFSKEPILDNFGELAYGEIPEPLKHDRPYKMTVLDNGIRVVTESWNHGLASIGVFVDAGTRYENSNTSGSAHFLEHIIMNGSKKRSRNELFKEVENMGASLDAFTSREYTLFNMNLFPRDIDRSVEILGDILQNPSMSSETIELERDTIKVELEESNKDSLELILEAAHFNNYRDHMIGSPILGDIENINNISADMVRDYHKTHYVGKNLIIVGTGNIEHNHLVENVRKHFGGLSKNSAPGLERINTNKPNFTPSCMFMRDDERYNTAVGVFYDAPGWLHEDYFSFLILERILGNYSMDKNGPQHLNTTFKQYSMLEGHCGALPDVQKAQGIYSPYRDCGFFGTYLHGNEVFTRQMAYFGLFIPASFGRQVHQVEVYRARNKLYNELLALEHPSEVLQLLGPQILYLNRKISRAEIAKRVAYINDQTLQKVAYEWFYDAEPSIVAYGPTDGLSGLASYRYFKINTYVTNLSLNHSLTA
jgi:predicted Zn-dependent peptidase